MGKVKPFALKKQYGIYSVTEEWQADGRWAGYRCAAIDSIGKKQGKLYIPKDGRSHYREKKEEDLEL
jgi:hypothetical protein